MPYESDKFKLINQIDFLLDTLVLRNVLNDFERDTLKNGKRPPPRGPGDQ